MKVIVYGLGQVFEQDKNIIENSYEVIGYCDIDNVKVKKWEGVSPEQLVNLDETAWVLITPVFETGLKIADYLSSKGITYRRMLLWEHEKRQLQLSQCEQWGMTFNGQYYTDAYIALLFLLMGYRFCLLHNKYT